LPTDLARLDATAGLALIAEGRLEPHAWAAACLKRATMREPEVHAWAHLDPAQVLGAQSCAGPLHGVPIGVKDVILTKDMPTQYNSPIYAGFHPQVDAACVAVLRAAGALIFGKTQTVEFAATGRKAQTRNPHDLTRTPGGSSSGSAAAVADFHVPIALGTQTGGSILRPASYCGVYGFKPTWNLVNAEGAKTFARSLDTIGWFARSAEDLALIYEVFAPAGEPTAPALDLDGARIAVYRSPAWREAEPATQDAMAAAEIALSKAGAQVSTLMLPVEFDRLIDAHIVIMRSEGSGAFLAEYRIRADLLDPSHRGYVENVHNYARNDLLDAHNLAARCREMFDEIAGGYDAVLSPSVTGEAAVGLAATGSFVFNAAWSLLHTPAINLPGFRGPNGLPVGLTVTGPRFTDRAVLAAACALSGVFRETTGANAAPDERIA
jgi:Asp-tRNA(Asn)/Glu-tRNA(Gln) amidotransferase A subunit family amidase